MAPDESKNQTASGDLAGLQTVVTGSSSGIGRAIALEFARAGADVIVHARKSRPEANDTALSCRKFGVRAEVILADVAETVGRRALVDQALATFGKFDVWVNNAGADVLTGQTASCSFEEKLSLLWNVDVLGTICLSRTVGAMMRGQGNGSILNIGWDQATAGMEGESGEMFSAVKGAVMAFSKSLALSLAPEVRVNCLAPGWIRTAWGDGASKTWQKRVLDETPLGRWGQSEDVAAMARFLSSPAAAFITGQTVAVNGGAVRRRDNTHRTSGSRLSPDDSPRLPSEDFLPGSRRKFDLITT